MERGYGQTYEVLHKPIPSNSLILVTKMEQFHGGAVNKPVKNTNNVERKREREKERKMG